MSFFSHKKFGIDSGTETKRTKCIFAIWCGKRKPLIKEVISEDDKFQDTQMKENCQLPESVDPRFCQNEKIIDM